MKCPYCKSDDISHRGKAPSNDGNIWRKKRCMSCGKWFFSEEKVSNTTPIRCHHKTNWIGEKLNENIKFI